MTVEIQDPEAVAEIERQASATGKTPVEVVSAAIKAHAHHSSEATDPSVEQILELVRGFRLRPINQNLSDDEILGYGADGICR